LINLLENACKFASKGGSIDVRGHSYFWERRSVNPDLWLKTERRHGADDGNSPNTFRVDVYNTGPTISSERLGRIFDEYTSYGGREKGGTGLGLAICKLMVQRHRGRIWAENRPGGPMISFVLPFQPAAFDGSIEAVHNGVQAASREHLA